MPWELNVSSLCSQPDIAQQFLPRLTPKGPPERRQIALRDQPDSAAARVTNESRPPIPAAVVPHSRNINAVLVTSPGQIGTGFGQRGGIKHFRQPCDRRAL